MGRDHPRSPPSGRRPTSRDVAVEAGVSRATVSYVLNGADQKHRITPATRDRVLEAAERLGYEPNAVALALRAGRTEIVLVEMPNWPLGPPMTEAIDTIVDSLEELGYTPLVHFQRADPRSLVRASQRVHPVAVIAPGTELPAEVTERLRALGARGLVAFADRPLPQRLHLRDRPDPDRAAGPRAPGAPRPPPGAGDDARGDRATRAGGGAAVGGAGGGGRARRRVAVG